MFSNLVVVRCGPSSLHEHWLRSGDRHFDLAAAYYGDTIPEDWRPDELGYDIVKIPGGKWEGLFAYLTKHDHWRRYERIFLPDDDLLFSVETANAFFRVVASLGADLAQPALDDASYFSHTVTLLHGSFRYRRTNFVELMCPCFSRRFLEKTLPLFATAGTGWGLDFFWTDMLRELRYEPPLIVDETPVRHTRPVGSAGHGVPGKIDPKKEMRAFRAQRGLKKSHAVTRSGVLCDGTVTSPTKKRWPFLRIIAGDLVAHRHRMKSKHLRKSLVAHISTALGLRSA